MKNRVEAWIGLWFGLLMATGCGSDNKVATITANVLVPSGVTSLSVLSLPRLSSLLDIGGDGLSILTAGDVGSASSSDVLSLKYHVFDISVCESMTTSGTAFSNPTNCLKIYNNGTDSQSGTWAYDSNNIDASAMVQTVQNNSSEVIDLMSSSSRTKLTTGVSATKADARSYNWGYITWYPAIVVKGQVTLGNGTTTLRTLGGAFNGSNKWITSSTMTSGTAADAYVYTGNGGTWFKFQNPLVLSEQDVNNNAQIKVDLAFNPDGFFKGVNSNAYAGCGTCVIGDSSNNWMTVPMLDITPIPHKASESVMRDTYVATISGGSNTGEYKLRIQFYYLKDDSSKTIYGVNTNTLFTSNTKTFIYDLPKISFVESNTDGSVNLKIWDESKLIQNFTRKSSVGETTTATVNCGVLNSGGWNNDDCSSGSSFSATFTLTESGKLTE